MGGMWIDGHGSDGALGVSSIFHDSDGRVVYCPGPLTVPSGITNEAASLSYQCVWKVTREQVERHLLIFNCRSDPNCSINDELTAGHIIPTDIAAWPAMGPSVPAYASCLAPFFDYNQDGSYDAQHGDVPCILCSPAIRGVFNDCLSLADGHPALRQEVQQMPFGFSSDDSAIEPMVFFRHHLIDRSSHAYSNTTIGFFNDFGPGCADDVFMGCDPSLKLAYAYAWSDFDPTCREWSAMSRSHRPSAWCN